MLKIGFRRPVDPWDSCTLPLIGARKKSRLARESYDLRLGFGSPVMQLENGPFGWCKTGVMTLENENL